jgi:hypothetical protein
MQFGKEVERNPENQKSPQAESERNQQFTQQIAVKQTHSMCRVAMDGV